MKQGIEKGMSINDYHANMEWMSSTMLRKAAESPKHLWHYMNKKDDQRKSHFDFGNAFELALLDKEGFANDVVIYDDSEIIDSIRSKRPDIVGFGNTKEYKLWKAGFYEENADRYVIQKDGKESYETIEAMLESCYQDKVIQAMIKNIEYQYSLMWVDHDTGLQLKTRPDICKMNKNIIVDVKTALDGSPDGFSKAIGNHKLHIQAIMQIDGVLATGAMPQVDAYFWLVVEKTEPYNATLYEFVDWQQDEARDEYRFLLNTVKQSKDKNFWPGYSQWADNEWGIIPAPIKPWTFKKYSYE